jgi:hypothetical protein
VKRLVSGAAVALLLAAAPALARAKDVVFVTTAAVKDKPAVSLDKAQGHILLRSDAAMPLYLMKVPSAEDQAAYDTMRAEALIEARGKYTKKLASYERAKALADSAKKNGSSAPVTVPTKPIEPTEENFEFTAFGLLSAVSIGPMNRFAKQEGGASVYLQAVTPGIYRIYGPITVIPNSAVLGTCLCMGSVSFEVRAGEIVDMGMIAMKAPPTDAGDATETEGIVPFNFQLQPATPAMAVDARLAGIPIRPAAYRPVGKLPNYFGLTIDRLAEMPGVVRYEGDRIIDLTVESKDGR